MKKYSGFTLLEMIVVVAVMGLISSMALDVYVDKTNQHRFELTKERLAEIKFAIIGDPQMRVGSQAVMSGFYYDLGRLPLTLSELLYQCRNATGIGVAAAEQATCEATIGNVWEEDWQGPYIINIQSENSGLTFRDAWGNEDLGNGNWGWLVINGGGGLSIKTMGLDRLLGGVEGYEMDYPTGGALINVSDLAYIDNLKNLQLLGYCVDTASNTIDLSIKDEGLCTDTWAAIPIASGYCVDTITGIVDVNFIDMATCEANVNFVWVLVP